MSLSKPLHNLAPGAAPSVFLGKTDVVVGTATNAKEILARNG